MRKTIEVHIPKYPECWTSCGNCGRGEIVVDDVLVSPGDSIKRDDTLIVLETGKIALDIPSPNAGRVVELFVSPGDLVKEFQTILTLEIPDHE
jgi:pyruvate/2-oxoglutarate dehydrogenase complex dihydrolipoamide acyltransferase (E2) component